MEHNRMFYEMNQAALERLAGRDPHQIAQNAGVRYDEETQDFCFSSLGKELRVHYPDYTVTPELPGMYTLVILHYLDLADGAPLTGEEMTFGQMLFGMVRGGGIDRKCELTIQKMKDCDPAQWAELCAKLGAEAIASNADIAYRIPFLPRFPVTLKIWLPDEDFPASGRLLTDTSADHYLTIEDAVMVAELLLECLTAGKE